jgi:FtsP/CotA-like multicopper oxidase with cupredoxin domain
MDRMSHHQIDTGTGTFSRDPSGLPMAEPTREIALIDGDRLDLRIAPVAKRIGDSTVRMLAYNGSIPGPTLRVRQGSEIVVAVTNDGDMPATVHWHGLRLENRDDGVPHETQKPIAIGETFTYRVRFPDEGVYWYHPHIREDYGIDMGLYGNMIVEPAQPDHWPPCDRDVVLTIDDLLLEHGEVEAYDRAAPDHVAMGRFGNVFLVSGRPGWTMDAREGEVVRFFLTNTANTRVFNLRFDGARMKLVGGDSGRYEHETFVDAVLLAPSERAVVDVAFDRGGSVTLQHVTPDQVYALGSVAVAGVAEPGAIRTFDDLRTSPELSAERDRLDADLQREPDEVLALVAEMDMAAPSDGGSAAYACPMDPEVVSDVPDRCPKCGMKLLPIAMVPAALELLETRGHEGDTPGHEAGGHAAGSIEWEDTMVDVNRETNPSNMRWLLVDRATGAQNASVDWTFTVGDRVKIRIVNEMDSDHPMHHPFHVHGAGRFLVLSRDGVTEPNLVWKDTVLVRTGEVVDILLDVSNPGLWMAHCHIAEHAASGMMFSFNVKRA